MQVAHELVLVQGDFVIQITTEIITWSTNGDERLLRFHMSEPFTAGSFIVNNAKVAVVVVYTPFCAWFLMATEASNASHFNSHFIITHLVYIYVCGDINLFHQCFCTVSETAFVGSLYSCGNKTVQHVRVF